MLTERDQDITRRWRQFMWVARAGPNYLRSHLLAVFNRIDRGDSVRVARNFTSRRVGARG